MSRGAPHTEFRRGQAIFVLMKSGTHFKAKYIEKRSGSIIVERFHFRSGKKQRQAIPLKDVRQIVIDRPRTSENNG